jgi:hypothetical protein
VCAIHVRSLPSARANYLARRSPRVNWRDWDVLWCIRSLMKYPNARCLIYVVHGWVVCCSNEHEFTMTCCDLQRFFPRWNAYRTIEHLRQIFLFLKRSSNNRIIFQNIVKYFPEFHYMHQRFICMAKFLLTVCSLCIKIAFAIGKSMGCAKIFYDFCHLKILTCILKEKVQNLRVFTFLGHPDYF